MLFENYHLFDFVTGTRGAETRYNIPDPNDTFADDDFGYSMDACESERRWNLHRRPSLTRHSFRCESASNFDLSQFLT